MSTPSSSSTPQQPRTIEQRFAALHPHVSSSKIAQNTGIVAAIVAINDKKSAAEATIQSEREACRAVIVRVNEGKAGMDALDEATRNLRVVEEVCRQNIEALEEEERVLLGVLMA